MSVGAVCGSLTIRLLDIDIHSQSFTVPHYPSLMIAIMIAFNAPTPVAHPERFTSPPTPNPRCVLKTASFGVFPRFPSQAPPTKQPWLPAVQLTNSPQPTCLCNLSLPWRRTDPDPCNPPLSRRIKVNVTHVYQWK
jgi:hypothetical protein